MRRSGQIIAKGKGCWRVRWYRGTDEATGRKRYASETVHGTKRDAERRLAEILGKVERGVTVTTTGVTVGEMLKQWLADPAAQGHRRARTIKNYRDLIDGHIVPRLGRLRVDRLDPATLRSRLVHPLLEAGKKRTAQHARDVLSVALEWAAESKRYGIDANPIRGTVRIHGTGAPAPGSLASCALTHEQALAFRGAIQGDRHELLFLVMLATGVRPSEALALQWRDIAWSTEDRRRWAGEGEDELARSAANGEGACLLVRRTLIPRDKVPWVNGEPVFAPPKTAAGLRVIPLPIELVRRLREHRAGQAGSRLLQRLRRYDHDLVFVGRSGQPLSLTSLRNNHFKPALRRARLPASIRMYDLRHTAATHAVMAAVETGAGVTSVGRWIGHASLKMTLDTYTHATEEGTRAVSEAVAGALLGGFTPLSHPPSRDRDS